MTLLRRNPAGQKQRIGSGSFEEITNRQQKRLVRAYDTWAAKLNRMIKRAVNEGANTARLHSIIVGQMPDLEKSMLEVTRQGIMKAAKVAAEARMDSEAVQSAIANQIRENDELVSGALIPHIEEKLTGAVTQAFGDAKIITEAISTMRPATAAYAGGAWVMVFVVKQALGKEREMERRTAGEPIEKVRWVLDSRAVHCVDSPGHYGCVTLAKEYNSWDDLPTVPAGQTTCRGNCRCHLEVFREGQWRRGVFDD